jgi:hypothetical protein
MLTADRRSGLKTDARQRGADGSYKDEDEKLRADIPPISVYMLECGKKHLEGRS